MDNEQLKKLLIETLQENIRIKQQLWELHDKLYPPKETDMVFNEKTRKLEIEEIQNILGDLLDL